MKENKEIFYDVTDEEKLKLEKQINELVISIKEKKADRNDHKSCVGDFSSALDGESIVYANDLGLLYARLNRLLNLKNITRIMPAEDIEEKISLLDIVGVEYEDGEVEKYQIVFGADDALDSNVEEDGFYKTTLQSRIGTSLFGKKEGDTVEGFINCKIVSVERIIEKVDILEEVNEAEEIGKKVR